MPTVSDFVIGRVREWGVSRVFGFPGDGIGEFDGALEKAQREGDGLDYVRPTHEEICAFMATAHAKFTGEVGVCIATSSPGAFHMVNGLYDAKMDNQPVVAIVGQQGLNAFGTSNQQASHLERTMADVAVYVQTVVSPAQAQAVVDTAFRTARTQLGPAVIILPHDVQGMEFTTPEPENWVSRSSAVAPSTRIRPPEDDILRAAEIINAGEKVTFFVGHGANGATDEVLEAARRAGAGIITALRGKQVVPADVPYHTQQLGLLGSLPSYHQVKDCDTLVFLGTNYPYGQFLPPSGQARAIQIDLKPEQMGLRYPTELNLWGDVKSTLDALIPHLDVTTDLEWQDRVAAEMVDWEKEMTAQAMQTYDDGVNPRRVYHELNRRLPATAIVTADAGTTADWYGHHIRLQRGMMGDLSGRLASMLAAMPYAMAAKFAYSQRPVICTIGDGAFQMLGMNELITIKKYMAQWSNPQLIILVLHNNDLAQVSWEMRTEDANPVWSASQDVESVDYAGWAELLGFTGIRVHSDDEVEAAWDRAFATQGVTLIDAYTSPNVPPLPPHVTFEFAKNTGEALLKNDPRARDVIRDTAKAVLTEGVERVKDTLHIGNADDEGDAGR
ncbi:thiamine pyrophosphate-requiring protein [Microbacterium horticulturae]|uniref:Thiamine pyrophosphate-requiring protein n=1 Tax=Microbacterium horticulturae TaxID=3028316 RepID=A0ABY8BUY5_9MICO|nr:thiamine pyrophosphate-requiring protein [Microbacterium sp. KACC 23027]WEG07979.1 thiamine pyrophosphate-requiring protein [Microbacterium sp. KACC 23027]